MAQLRQDIDQFIERDTAVLVIGPENAQKFANYFAENDLPFVGLPDPNHTVLKQYGQEIKLFKFGRMPAQVLVDKQGIARYVHYGKSMSDIPATDEIVAMLDEINSESEVTYMEVGNA
jgi:peroxiredoxin Q/BCP